jgi:acyl dehydratase
MGKELYYEDVAVGTEIPPLVKHPTTQQLVRWAGASEDYYQLHYDKDFALSQGLPGVIVHGKLKYAFLVQMLCDWSGDGEALKKLSVSYRGVDFPGQELVCKGKVTGKYVEGEEHCIECEVWTENPKGERTTLGTGIVVLPSKVKT